MKQKKNELITGVEYWRCKRQVRKTDLEAILGGSNTLRNWSKPDSLMKATNTKKLLQVAALLDVTADQLFEVHSVAELADGDRPQYPSKYVDPGNSLSNYRIRNGLSFQQLADRMGVSRQYAQESCQNSCAPKAAIKRICVYENMAPEEFLDAYGDKDSAA